MVGLWSGCCPAVVRLLSGWIAGRVLATGSGHGFWRQGRASGLLGGRSQLPHGPHSPPHSHLSGESGSLRGGCGLGGGSGALECTGCTTEPGSATMFARPAAPRTGWVLRVRTGVTRQPHPHLHAHEFQMTDFSWEYLGSPEDLVHWGAQRTPRSQNPPRYDVPRRARAPRRTRLPAACPR